MMASSVPAVVFLGAALRAEMKTVPTTATTATMNEMRRGALSTPPFNHPPRWARATAMRARVSVIIIGGGSGTEPAAFVPQWRSMVVVVIGSLPLLLMTMVEVAFTSSVDGGGGNDRPCHCGIGG